MKIIDVAFESTLSRTKRCLMPICLTFRQPLTSSLHDIDPRFSCSSWVGSLSITFSSCNIIRNHLTSQIACERALNSASSVDCAVQDWTFDVQIFAPPLLLTRSPVLEYRSEKSVFQSPSAHYNTIVSFRLTIRSNFSYSFVGIKSVTTLFSIFQSIALRFDWNFVIMDTAVELSALVRVERNRSTTRTFRNGTLHICADLAVDKSLNSSYNVCDNGRGLLVNFSFDIMLVWLIF